MLFLLRQICLLREPHRECAPLARLADQLDMAMVIIDDVFNKGQSQTATASVVLRGNAEVFLENLLLMFQCYPDTVICDADAYEARLVANRYPDHALGC